MFEFDGRNPGTPDALFLERLDTFMDKCLADIKAFSEREYRPFEETRQYVAEWHSKYLFQTRSCAGVTVEHDSVSKVRSVLCDASRILESLCETSGVQSFLLAVDPSNPSDGGFLGGSVVGREFWRGLRGGGEAGAKSFRAHCRRETEPRTGSVTSQEGLSSIPGTTSTKQGLAKSLKNELYETVRKALRSVSNIRNAEMRWTNPERLDVYGVRLVGWPPSIPAQNPSTLKSNQNKLLLECLENGTMRFEKTVATEPSSDLCANTRQSPDDEADVSEDFSWAYDADGGDSSRIIVSQDFGSEHASENKNTQLPTSSTSWITAQPSGRKRRRSEGSGAEESI